MNTAFFGKTVRLAMTFAGMGFVLIVGDASYFQATGDHLSFVTEFFGLLGLMFGAITTKNAADNFIAYRERTVSAQYGPVPPNAPPQPEV